jgi:hypothetical protein
MDAIVPRKSPDTRTVEQRRSHARSRLTNKKDILRDIDGRTLIFRRYKDITAAVAADQGGFDSLSEARLQLVRRFSACCVLAEGMEARLARGEEIDVERHSVLCSTLVRLSQRIGIDRRSRIVNPTVADYLETKAVKADTTIDDVEAAE